MTDKKKDSKVTKDGAVELDEGQLDQASGGAAFIKFDGVDGESISAHKLAPSTVAIPVNTAAHKLRR